MCQMQDAGEEAGLKMHLLFQVSLLFFVVSESSVNFKAGTLQQILLVQAQSGCPGNQLNAMFVFWR